jgi:hypothetical protein
MISGAGGLLSVPSSRANWRSRSARSCRRETGRARCRTRAYGVSGRSVRENRVDDESLARKQQRRRLETEGFSRAGRKEDLLPAARRASYRRGRRHREAFAVSVSRRGGSFPRAAHPDGIDDVCHHERCQGNIYGIPKRSRASRAMGLRIRPGVLNDVGIFLPRLSPEMAYLPVFVLPYDTVFVEVRR